MVKEKLEQFFSRLGRTGVIEERDRQLIKLLRDFEALDNDQKLKVIPMLEQTLSRHESIRGSQAIIRAFLKKLGETLTDKPSSEPPSKAEDDGSFH